MLLSPTAQKAIDAYGGAGRWARARTLEAVVSTRGWAFILKGRPFFNHARIRLTVHAPHCSLTPIGRRDAVAGVLDGHDVCLIDDRGRIVGRRTNARDQFSYARRLVYWDDLDMAYFANYAFWNYFTLPVLLMRKDIEWSEVVPGVLDARFPDAMPTHSRHQRFVFDIESGLLREHHYTADIISRFARASNVVLAHGTSEGAAFPSIRRVTPRNAAGSALPFPELIYIEVHQYGLGP